MANKYKSSLNSTTSTFDNMMKNGFGVVTVMNARVYKVPESLATKSAYDIVKTYGAEQADAGLLANIDSLKIANVTIEGPSKTVTGGRYSNPLIKFGKSARLEMQDALGTADAIEALCGGIKEYTDAATTTALHFGGDFASPKMIIGDSFFIDKDTGHQVPVKIIFYQFLPDSIFNLTQDAQGDATVFDMNGDLLSTEILVGDAKGQSTKHGVFYSIVDPTAEPDN